MASKTLDQIRTEILQIKNETIAKANSATRVGGVMGDIIDHVEGYIDEKADAQLAQQATAFTTAEAARDAKVDAKVGDITELQNKTKNITTENIGSEDDDLVIESENGEEIAKVNSNGVDVIRLSVKGKNAISYEGTATDDKEEQVFTNDLETEEYAKIGSYGVRAKSYQLLDGTKVAMLPRTIIVDCNGKGDYTTIDDALANANDSKNNHVTIIVMPGTYYPAPKKNNISPYEESKRNISIIGVNRDACILLGNCGYYYWQEGIDYSLLRLSGNVLIKNLTLINTSEQYESTAIENGWDLTSQHNRAYCWHNDMDKNEGDYSVMENCRCINDHFSCVGWGLRQNSTLKLKDCELISNVSLEKNNQSGFSSYGTIYGHLGNTSNKEGQRLEIIDCCITNVNNECAIYQMGQNNGVYDGVESSIILLRNSVNTTDLTKAFKRTIVENMPLVNKIDELSFGNNFEF